MSPIISFKPRKGISNILPLAGMQTDLPLSLLAVSPPTNWDLALEGGMWWLLMVVLVVFYMVSKKYKGCAELASFHAEPGLVKISIIILLIVLVKVTRLCYNSRNTKFSMLYCISDHTMWPMLVREQRGSAQSPCQTGGHLLMTGHQERAALLAAMLGEDRERLEIIHGLYTPSFCNWHTCIHIFLLQTSQITLP